MNGFAPSGLYSIMGVVPTSHRICYLLNHLCGTTWMVLMGTQHALWLSAHVRIHHNDPSRNADVQVHQHLYRRLVRFVIKMPTLYRIGCFRDDIIFLIYLYQRWVYRVDTTRMNEYGTSGEREHGVPRPLKSLLPRKRKR
ncbi:hypothetical protein CAEBREN_17856 [Caenorhabditis brenneri]|uniref:Uncharacterized protein n=1 Tax=Caenorhabditis brenneri TaxID=135651 RepID=G0P2M2_CAEBE|nr:hypothetical protein CAEBREN_17856 [Caenorhabditis brenneri]